MSGTAPCSTMACAHQYGLLHKLCRLFPSPAAASSGGGPASYSRHAPGGRRSRAATAATPVAELDSAASHVELFVASDYDSDAVDDGMGLPEAGLAAPAAAAAQATSPAAPLSKTGAFQRLPMVSPSKELINSALRRAERTPSNKKLKNEAAKAKNRAARCLDTLMKELTAPLSSYERGFPPFHRLHPFEQALLELTVGPGTYERALARVAALRKASVEVSKGFAARASKAANKKEALALQAEGFERVEALFLRGGDAVDELKDVAKSLRRLPVVDPGLPTVALVGAPNVGKSSLVQLLSSGLPEVQNYPFTTRSIKMGHFYVDSRRHQVTDTPGLLNRPDADRNAMERLTLASLQHLPTAVLFVADLTGECGTSLADQWRIRCDLRGRFPAKPWLDVLSKADLLEEEFDVAEDLLLAAALQQQQCGTQLPGAAQADGSRSAQLGGGGGGFGPGAIEPVFSGRESPDPLADAVAFAAGLPRALRVSSLTGAGVEELKGAMLRMLEERDLAQQGLEAWGSDDEEGRGKATGQHAGGEGALAGSAPL